MIVDADEVTKALSEEGAVELEFNAESLYWGLSFNINATPQSALLLAPPDEDYFLIAAQIVGPPLMRKFKELPSEVLQAILLTQGEVSLAKFHIVNPDVPMYASVSYCSMEGWSGKKLMSRLYACANLAAKIRAAVSQFARTSQ